MNKFVLAALVGAITYSQVEARRLAVAEPLDDDTFMAEPEYDDFQDLETGEFAPKKPAAKAAAKPKGDESNDDSTSDDERHEAYKDGERNTANAIGQKNQKAEKKAKKGGKGDKKDKEDKPHVRAQTLESLQQSAADAQSNADELKKLADTYQQKVRDSRKEYDEKYKVTQEAGKAYHEAMDDAGDAKDKMKRASRRLEHEKHEALHEAIMEQKARVKRRRWDEKELKERALDEATSAAAKVGATATQSMQAAKAAHNA
jgi:hypothetical protein